MKSHFLATTFLTLGALALSAPSASAQVSATCSGFSGQFSSGTFHNGVYSANLVAGDVMTVVVAGAGTVTMTSLTLGSSVVLNALTPGTYSYTVTTASAGVFNILAGVNEAAGITFSTSWSCAHPTGPGIQQGGSQIEGRNTLFNTNDVLDSVIANSMGDGFTPVSGGPNGVTMMVAPGQQGTVTPTADVPMVSDSPWRLWMAGRYTHASGTATGDQFNGYFGMSHRLGEGKAYGLFGGAETFSYSDAALSSFTGAGGSFGGFLAGQLGPRLKLDARAYGTLLNYNITSGGATGSTSAQRLGTSLTASYELAKGPVSVTPFLRGAGLFEWQAAYTDSAAVAHLAQNLSQGIIAPGIRLSRNTALADGGSFTPYISVEADYVFGNAILAGFTDVQGLAGKVNAGAAWTNAKGQSLSLDAGVSGLGSSITSASAQVTVKVPF